MIAFRSACLAALAATLAGCAPPQGAPGPTASEPSQATPHPKARHVAALPVGAVIASQGPDGRARSRVVTSVQPGAVVATAHDGALGDGPVTARLTYDLAGNLIRSEDARGRVWRYEPHNCANVMGRCEYASIGPTRTDRHRRVQEVDGLELVQRWYWCPSRFDCRLRQTSTSGYSEDGRLLWFEEQGGPGRVEYSYRLPDEG